MKRICKKLSDSSNCFVLLIAAKCKLKKNINYEIKNPYNVLYKPIINVFMGAKRLFRF